MIRLVTASQPIIDSSRLTTWERIGVFFRVMRYARVIWDKLLLRILVTQILAFVSVIPIAVGIRLIDDALPQRDMRLLVRLVLIILAVRFVERVFGFTHDVVAGYGVARVPLSLGLDFYKRVRNLSLKQFNRRPIGEHMFRCTADVGDCLYLINDVIPTTVFALQRMGAMLFMLHTLGKWLIFPTVTYLIIFLAARHWFSTRIRRWDRRARHEGQQLTAALREILSAFRLVKGYNRDATAHRWYFHQLFSTMRAGWRRTMFTVFDGTFSATALGLFALVINMMSGLRVISDEMTLGEFSAVLGVVLGLIGPVQDLINIFQMVRQKLVPAERLIETLNIIPDIQDPEQPEALLESRGRIEVRGVSFAYDDVPVLRDVSVVAEAGEKIAIVGPTGAGKTTLTHLLVRLYDPSEGAILLDGVDVRRLPQRFLRESVGLVMQGQQVLAATVRENIAYGNARVSEADLRRAAELADAAGFIDALSQGYDTLLTEGGALSGGQKQRLCLARGLLRSPKVLILDEATSALDPLTETQVIGNIDAAFEGITQIVVAHNLLSTRNANRIYVLDLGRIVETGTHKSLMERQGMYYRLWTEAEQQSRQSEL
jgi:ABC-type multidrug transport system fused ATPase/permease subunit